VRRVGLDIGERRIGVAVSDPSGRVATPVRVLDAKALDADISPLRRLVDDYEPGELVVGLPLTMAGEEGPQAQRVRAFADRLAAAVGLPLVYWDERLSSSAAEKAMGQAGSSARDRRGAVDMVAATLILQGYLDAHAVPAADGDRGE
jgi:putative holliday junction resolvase